MVPPGGRKGQLRRSGGCCCGGGVVCAVVVGRGPVYRVPMVVNYFETYIGEAPCLISEAWLLPARLLA